MVLYKFFRDGIPLYNAIRYDETFFSSNEYLNDVDDLSIKFLDNSNKWREVLTQPNCIGVSPSDYFDINEDIIGYINKYFLGKELNGVSIDDINYISEHLRFLQPQNPDINKISDVLHIFFSPKIKLYSCSFSGSLNNQLMWAHYADGFKGAVIEYDFPESISIKSDFFSSDFAKVHKVQYEHNIRINPLDYLMAYHSGGEFDLSGAVCKNTFWEYENEYRIVIAVNGDNKSFPKGIAANFTESYIKKVYLGVRANKDMKLIINESVKNKSFGVDTAPE